MDGHGAPGAGLSVSPFDSRLLAGLLGDAELAPLFSDEAAIEAMLAVERALARAQAAAGIVPPEAARAIDAALGGLRVAPGALAAGTAAAGVPVPALLAAARAALPPEAAHWLHWGATSQDIVDTALVLRLRSALAVMAGRLARVHAALDAAAGRWQGLPMAGRTRSQLAAPSSFGRRCAVWAAPFAGLGAELPALRARVERVQLGGAVGTNAVLGERAAAVAALLAGELGLAAAAPWHVDRTALGGLAGWCAGVAAASGKMAGDLVLMGRTESGEAASGAGGGSSTMPQKANPVAAETVVALARHAAVLAGAVHLAGAPAEERDGAAWTLEWLALPQLVLAAGVALRHAAALAEGVVPDGARMRANLLAGGGAAMAEAAVFLLAAHRPRAEAEAVVKAAVAAARAGGETLPAALARLAPGPVDWHAALAPERLLPPEPGPGDPPP